MSRINRILKTAFIVLVIFVVIMLSVSITVNYKGNKLENKIDDFKNRSEFVGEYIVNIKTDKTIAYYKVKKKYDYEINNDSRIYSDSSTMDPNLKFTDLLIGSIGDMYFSNNNSLGLIYTEWMSKKIYIGHSGIVSSDDGKFTYESSGKGDYKGVKELENNWLTESKGNVIVVRNKNNINKKELTEWLNKIENSKYNYLFFLKSKKRYYCTDLISRCYEESQGLKITNKSRFITGESIINNDENYIIYYREKSSKENVDYNVYYLE